MILSKLQLKNLMLYQRPFLADLYTSNPLTSEKLLQNSTDEQLQLIIQVIYFIANGIISLPRKSFDNLEKSKKLLFINENFCSKRIVIRLLKSIREERLEKLSKLNDSFSDLLFPLFNEMNIPKS